MLHHTEKWLQAELYSIDFGPFFRGVKNPRSQDAHAAFERRLRHGTYRPAKSFMRTCHPSLDLTQENL